MLRTYLDEVLDRAARRDPERRDVLRSMLKVMVESTGTRRFVALPDVCRGLPDVKAEQLEQHLRQLEQSRILETRVQDATVQYSLSHEVLVEKVQSWFDERELQRKKAQETLERGLAEWQSSGAVFNAKQVAHIRQWLPAGQLDARAGELLSASQQAHDERQREKAEQARRMRVFKYLAAGLLVLFLLSAALLSLWALGERKEAQRQAVIAEKEAVRAERQAAEAKHQARVALIRSLAAYALQDNAREERERAALLARHAYLLIKQDDPEAEELYQQVEDALRTIFRTEAIAQGPGHDLSGKALSEYVCQQVKFKKALEQEEWEQLAGAEIEYKEACPELKTTNPLWNLRSKPIITSDENLFNPQALSLNIGPDWNPVEYIEVQNRFEEQGEVIFDEATGLMWQKAGSMNSMTYTEAWEYVRRLNLAGGFAGYKGWRLPTVEELLSLIEPQRQSNDQYINPVFDATQIWVWSMDIRQIKDEDSAESAWEVDFYVGSVGWSYFYYTRYVRCVRSGQ